MARIDLPEGDDEELIRVFQFSPALGAAAGGFGSAVYAKSLLPVRLRELLRIRIAQINDCPI